MLAGVRPAEAGVTEGLLSRIGEVRLDVAVGRHAGGYLSRFGKSHGVEVADALIAAAAVRNGLPLWTGNRRHFPMPDLTFHSPENG